MLQQPRLQVLRQNDTVENAILFVHGFSGDEVKTWQDFQPFLLDESSLKQWDVFSLGYPSEKLSPDIRGIWTGDPSIQTIADSLYTQAFFGQLGRYKGLAFIAHSMGGLVVQRSLLDHQDLLQRTSHVFLFGTPSNGLKKAGWGKWFKRQAEDMDADGKFIKKLRNDWAKTWPKTSPPHLRVIAGDQDEFVPVASSLSPFSKEHHFAVPGNHQQIVHPQASDNLSVQIVIKGIRGDAAPAGPWNSARVALQMLDFRTAVNQLESHADELDDAHLVELALALDGLDKRDKALELLVNKGRKGTDAQGVLAGRFKRRWQAEGRQKDYEQAFELYEAAYETATQNQDHPQAFYHGINLCFLLTAKTDNNEQSRVEAIAQEILEHCQQAPQDFWCLGTQGEAQLYLNHPDEALNKFQEAMQISPQPKPWQVRSMYEQVAQVADIMGHYEIKESQLEQIFRQAE